MAYCVKCGTKVEEGVKFCPQCGEAIPQIDRKAASDARKEQMKQSREGQKEKPVVPSGGGRKEDTYQEMPHQSASAQEPPHLEEYFSTEEVKRNRVMGVLSYLGILVLIPIFVGNKKSEYVRQHLNQGLSLYILSILADLLMGEGVLGLRSIISFGGTLFAWVFDIVGIVCIILAVVGIIYAVQGKRKKLPLVGKMKFWR